MNELEFYDGAWSGQEIDAGIGLTGTLANALAIVVDGNKSAVSAAVGQYVLVKNSTITSISDGLYTAAQAIPAATAIDATYLTAAVSGGGLNDVKTSYYDTVSSGASKTITLSPSASVWLLACGNPGNNDLLGAWVVVPGTTSSTGQARKIGGTSYLTVSVAGTVVTLSNGSSATLRIGLVKMA